MFQLLHRRTAPAKKAAADRPNYDRRANQFCSHCSRRLGRPVQWHEFSEFNTEPNAVEGWLWRRHGRKCPDAAGGHKSRITQCASFSRSCEFVLHHLFPVSLP